MKFLQDWVSQVWYFILGEWDDHITSIVIVHITSCIIIMASKALKFNVPFRYTSNYLHSAHFLKNLCKYIFYTYIQKYFHISSHLFTYTQMFTKLSTLYTQYIFKYPRKMNILYTYTIYTTYTLYIYIYTTKTLYIYKYTDKKCTLYIYTMYILYMYYVHTKYIYIADRYLYIGCVYI